MPSFRYNHSFLQGNVMSIDTLNVVCLIPNDVILNLEKNSVVLLS